MKGFFVLSILIVGLSSTAAIPVKSAYLQPGHAVEKRYLLIEATKNSEGQYVCPDGYNKLDNNECAIKYRKVKRAPVDKIKISCPHGYVYSNGQCSLIR